MKGIGLINRLSSLSVLVNVAILNVLFARGELGGEF